MKFSYRVSAFIFGVLALFNCSFAMSGQKFHEEQVSFLVDGQRVVGTLTKPDDISSSPIVLILHGMSGNRHGPRGLFTRTARLWAQNGVASLRISTRGRGGSEGSFQNMTLERRTQEALAAINWIRVRNDLDHIKIGILGHSQGTIIAVSVASRLIHETGVKSLMLWAPQLNALATYRSSMGLATYNNGLNAGPREVVRWRGAGGVIRAFKAGFFRGLSKVDTLAEIANYRGRLLVVTGSRDRWSRTASAKVLARHHRGDHSFTEFDVGHRMGASVGPEKIDMVAKYTLDWLTAEK
ncbi:MAG: alpha/beta fold hydrolase [Rhizobiaceae bacterium]